MRNFFVPPYHFAGGSLRRSFFGLLFLLIAAAFTSNTYAQIAAWEPSSLSGYGPSPWGATSSDANLTVTGLSRGAGVGTGGTAAAGGWGGNDWTSADEPSATSVGDYAGFAIKANPGYKVSVSSMQLRYRRSNTGATSGELEYSLDGTTYTWAAALAYSSTSSSGVLLSTVDLSGITALQNVPAATTINFRIVNWGGSGGTGTWYVYKDAGTPANGGLRINGLVEVAAGCSGTPAGGTASAAVTTFCGSGSTTLSTSGGTAGTGLTYQWQSSATGIGGSFSDISGATDPAYVTPVLTATGYYQLVTTCTSSTFSGTSSVATVTINPIPAAIAGTTTVCSGSMTTLTDDSTGGTWTSGNAAIATIGTSSGTVTGVAAGSAPITYTRLGCTAISAVSVTSIVSAIGVTPLDPVTCAGDPSTLLSATGGVYAGGVAAATGTIDVSVGAASSTFPNAQVISGIPAGATITGVSVSLNLSSAFLHDYVVNLKAPNGNILNLIGQDGPSGTGSFTNTVISSSGSAAITSGSSPFTGTFAADLGSAIGIGSYISNITAWSGLYSILNGTWTLVPENVSTFPDADVFHSWSITISYTIPGTNTWSPVSGLFTDAGATIAYTGTASDAVYALPGSTTSYTVASVGGACSSNASTLVTVNPLPDTGIITGMTTVCQGSAITLTDLATGGTWSSDATGVASVDPSGVVTGVAGGNATISYTVTNSCGALAATYLIIVNPLPDTGVISGLTSVCAGGSTITLTNPATDGAWSSDATGIATVDAVGVVTGIVAGAVTISYTATNGCGTLAATTLITINPLPDTGIITGSTYVCEGSSIVLSDLAPGGVWSSDASGTASVDAFGGVTGVAAGIATISYAVTNGCGTLAATYLITVNPLPDTGIITGATSVCAGSSITLTDLAAGGVWSSDASGIAPVDASGVVTGVTAGTATISYTVTNGCGTLAATSLITVNSLADTGIITGATSVCAGSTITLADLAPGGTWSSDASGTASVDASGVVTGVAAGTATISYSVASAFCGTLAATSLITVNPLADTGIITGATSVCAGSSITLTDLAPGGTWSSDATGTASVDASGVVTGVAAGTATISYSVTNGCGTLAATYLITVNPLADTGIITGATSVCAGSSVTLTDLAPGGTWSSDASGTASVDASGIVTGVAAGTATISYSVTVGCGTLAATSLITVNPLADTGIITGATSVCAGSSVTLTDLAPGGVWGSDASGAASVDASGVVTGITAGTTTIYYSVTNGCGTLSATSVITVNPLADTGIITGPASVCAGSSVTLTDLAPGGTWSSGASGTASVSSSGVVTGVAAGTAIISYAVTNGCGTLFATSLVTVNPLADTGIITGATSVCAGSSITLTDLAPGGVWSSGASGTASVSASGVVLGVAAGNAIISYSVTNSCGTLSATSLITVNPLPVPGTISGASSVCAGSSVTLTDLAPGGTWSSTVSGTASVSASGVVTGVMAGTAIISYTVSNSCGTLAATSPITVNPLPVAGSITGTLSVCVAASTTLSDLATGGAWTSGASGTALVDAFGVVTGVSAGTAIISYSVINSCGTQVATATVTVNPLPVTGSITGSSVVCTGATITLSDVAPGGTWSSSSPVATVDASGTVTGIVAGAATISYSVTNGCGTLSALKVVTVSPIVTPSVVIDDFGSSSVCTGSGIFLSALPTNGGTAPAYTWYINGVAGVTTSSFSYVPANGDIIWLKLTSNAACILIDTAIAVDTITVLDYQTPSVSISASADPDCAGTPVTFTAAPVFGGFTPSYNWTNDGVIVATGPTYTYTPVEGDNIYCTMTSSYLCPLVDTAQSNIIMMIVTTPSLPSVSITANPGLNITAGQADTLTANVVSAAVVIYQWQVNGVSIAGATSATYISTFANGDVVTCLVNTDDICHLTSFDSKTIHVFSVGVGDPSKDAQWVKIIPDPNDGRFVVKGSWGTVDGNKMYLKITNMLGQTVYAADIICNSGAIDMPVDLDNTLPGGMYVLDLTFGDRKITMPLSVRR